MALRMLCWGFRANTRKITRHWPFELYYFDDTVGLLVLSLCIGMTLGRIDPIAKQCRFEPPTKGTGGYRSP